MRPDLSRNIDCAADPVRVIRDLLVQKVLRNIPAVLGNFLQQGFVRPDVPLVGIAHFGLGTSEFDRKLLDGSRAVIETEERHQIIDRLLPVERYGTRFGKAVKLAGNINHRYRNRLGGNGR